jgi:hypothetical protein
VAANAIDVLVAHKGAMMTEQPPDLTIVVTPTTLAGAVSGAARTGRREAIATRRRVASSTPPTHASNGTSRR